MKKILLISALTLSLFANEIVVKESSLSFDNTVSNIQTILSKKGLNIFAVVDHKSNANKVKMKMNESKVIIFGNPKMGTKLMQNNMLSALDLPLKILVYKDANNKVKVAYRDGSWLENEHSLTLEKLTNKVTNALDKITNKAIK